MNNTTRVVLLSLMSVAALAGCSKKVKEVPPADTDTAGNTGADHRPARPPPALTARATSTPTPACASAWCTSTWTRTP